MSGPAAAALRHPSLMLPDREVLPGTVLADETAKLRSAMRAATESSGARYARVADS